MKKSSVDALIDTCIILGAIAGIPFGFGLLISLVMSNIIYATIDYNNISQEWVHADVTGGSPLNPFIIICFVIILIAEVALVYIWNQNNPMKPK